ncbi:MAG: hypothetical protein M3Z35_16965 [Nitrospirota bacterium]|nr:hypothetical protein [Nitrospirota bacterium]
MQVELYAEGIHGSDPIRLEMTGVRQLAGACGGHIYSAAVSAARPSGHYTTHHPALLGPILWQR